MSVTGPSTASRRSGCSSTSALRAVPSTSASCDGCWHRRDGSSITPSRAWADRASARGRSSGVTSFPDGELIDVGRVVLAMEEAGFEVRDVESLREHYAKTLHAWVRNLERNWDAAVAEVGVRRARVWRLYMAASANGFEDGGISVHQVLGAVPLSDGSSGMPPTRAAWG